MMGHQSPYAPPPIPQRPPTNQIQISNVQNGETVHQRFLLVNGRAGPSNASFDKPIYVACNDFPQTEWPCVNSHFKALVHLTPGPNTITFAFPEYSQTLHFRVNYLPLLQNPPLSLVIMIGSDSPATFDVPPEKQGQNTLAIAVEKLRTAGYMWQAFCAEQMHRNGMGRRTFRLEEAWLPDTISGQDKGIMRHTAKVHVIRSKHTVADIRDLRRSQQSDQSDEENSESLFDYFLEALHENPPFDKPCTVAGLILDSHWDVNVQVSRGHTALGGGAGDTALGVFGSHLLHAWPTCIEDIVPSFMNNTVTDTRYVANDANESGNWWRAANIGMGAMLHEVGHSYTLSHTPTGIMSRGYNNWNRTFVAKEPGLAPIPPEMENGSHWHRADIMRLRFHPAFRIPDDGPLGTKSPVGPTFNPLESGQFEIAAPSGLASLELFVNDEYRTHYEFLKKQPTSIIFTLQDIYQRCQCSMHERVSLKAICTNLQTKDVSNLQEFLNSGGIHLPGVSGHVLKSDTFGSSSDEGTTKYNAVFVQESRYKQLRALLVNHGAFIDGFTFIWDDGSHDSVGKQGGGRTEFPVAPGERIQGINVRCGAWIDGIQFKLSSGRITPWFGGDGGGLHVVDVPQGYEMVGIFGSAKDWMEQVGIYYRRC